MHVPFVLGALLLNGQNVTPGDILEYTITITNTGGDDASASVLRDTIRTGRWSRVR